ncbi:hypothetical protein BH10PAT2_BH10PAT2_2930 [soil metagenome]
MYYYSKNSRPSFRGWVFDIVIKNIYLEIKTLLKQEGFLMSMQEKEYSGVSHPLPASELGLLMNGLLADQSVLTNFYQEEYKKRMPHDSPDRSRTEMAKDVLKLHRQNEAPNDFFLDIGSGPRALEKEIKAYAKSSHTPKPQLFSIDRSIFSLDLLQDYKRQPNTEFATANALTLPFAENTFGIVFSNHALDFIPRPSSNFFLPYQEAARVIAPGGFLVLNCHHPSLIDIDLNSIKHEPTRLHWGYLKRNDILLSSEEQIRSIISRIGLRLLEVGIRKDTCDKWWRILAQKPLTASES